MTKIETMESALYKIASLQCYCSDGELTYGCRCLDEANEIARNCLKELGLPTPHII